MLEIILEHGESAGFYGLLGAIVLMSCWESGAPRRSLSRPIRVRWTRNFSLFITSSAFARLAIPVFSVEASRIAIERNWGLLPSLGAPVWLNLLIGFVLLDLARYGLHWASHRYVLLWRMHRLHHTDQEFDYTTSLRFHPIELVVISFFNVGLIVVFGIHPVTVIIVEALSLTINTINHGNVRIDERFDRILRRVVVTPDMHRVHHSALPREFNANLGGLFPWWDRLFGTYVAQPRNGHKGMAIGLPGYAADEGGKFVRLLLDPFLSPEAEFRSESSSQLVAEKTSVSQN